MKLYQHDALITIDIFHFNKKVAPLTKSESLDASSIPYRKSETLTFSLHAHNAHIKVTALNFLL